MAARVRGPDVDGARLHRQGRAGAGGNVRLRASTRRRWRRDGTPRPLGGQLGGFRRYRSLGRPPCRRDVRRHRPLDPSGPIPRSGATPGSVCSRVEETFHRSKRSALVSDHRPGARPGLVAAKAARAGACEGSPGSRRSRPARFHRMASTRYSPATTRWRTFTRSSANGRLARALDGIAPKVKGGYVRCYRRFLSMIRV